MRNVVSMVALIGLLLGFSAASARADASSSFEGEWRLTATPDENAAAQGYQAFSDELLFHEGQMSAGALAILGFAPDTFATSEASGFPSFLSMLVSTDRGQIVFNGRLENEKLVGSIVWLRPTGDSTRYNIVAVRP